MKKKLLLCFIMIACILGITACGSNQTTASFITKEEAKENAMLICESVVERSAMFAGYGMSMSEYIALQGGNPADYADDIAIVDSYDAAAKEFGNFVSIIPEETEVEMSENKVDVKVKIQGDKVNNKNNKNRTATMEVVFKKNSAGGVSVDSISTSADYTMGELMEKAALNTVLGMGTVFAVLILICIIISWFNFIPKIQASFQKKPSSDIKEEAVTNAVTQIAAKEEAAPEDDLELIAVIAAAIAASEGAASADGYVVRSIFRRR